jgi:hypothetical protein
LQAGDCILSLWGNGNSGSGFVFGPAAINMFAESNWSASSTPTFINFNTTPVGATAAGERMRIISNGFVGIGTTTPASVLHVQGQAIVSRDADGGVSGSIGGLAQLTVCGASNRSKSLWLGFDTTNNLGSIQAGVSGVSWNALVLCPTAGNVGIGSTIAPATKLDVIDVSQPASNANAGGGSFRVSTGAPVTSEVLLFGVHNGDYSWIQAVLPGTTTRSLALNPNGGKVLVNATALDGTGAALQVTGGISNNGVLLSAGGAISVQAAVAGSRAINTTYHNTSGKPMLVSVALEMTSTMQAVAFTDAAASPTTQVCMSGYGGAGSTTFTLTFWVLTGNYYFIQATGGMVLHQWTEWT